MSNLEFPKFFLLSVLIFDCFYIFSSKTVFIQSYQEFLNQKEVFKEINIAIENLQKNEENIIFINESSYVQNFSCAFLGFKINIRLKFSYLDKKKLKKIKLKNSSSNRTLINFIFNNNALFILNNSTISFSNFVFEIENAFHSAHWFSLHNASLIKFEVFVIFN